MVWKQRLYAFLLRRVLGPYFSAESLKQLHTSIEVSLQEGRFSLNDVQLNAAFLSSRQSALVIHHVKIRKLQILLSLVESAEEEASSVTWRAMNLGREGGGVSLQAHIEVDGVEIHLGPPVTGTVPSPTPSVKKTVEEATSANSTATSSSPSSMLSSYIDAALASLRLTVDLKNVKIGIAGMEDQWIELDLTYARYHDKQSRGAAMHKAVDFSGISVQTCSPDNKELIAKLDGGGQVSLQAMNVGHESELRQDISLSLYQRINLSVGEWSIRCILSVVEAFSVPAESSSFPAAALAASQYFDAPPEIYEDDEKDANTMKGIMEQYAEARQCAERNEVRGGILIQDDDTMAFDAFFDANDLSFSSYRETLEGSVILSPAERCAEARDYVHTHIKFHLGEIRIKVLFPRRSIELPAEYLLLTCGEVNSTAALSLRSNSTSLSVSRMQVEVSQLTQHGIPEIETLLCFENESDPCSLVSPTPCIDVHWRKEENNKALEVHLQGLLVNFDQAVFDNFVALRKAVQPNTDTKTPQETTVVDPSAPETAISVCIASVTLMFPVRGVPIATFEKIFERCGYGMEEQDSQTASSVGLSFDDIVLTSLDSTYDSVGEDVTGHKLSCLRALLFVSAPHTKRPSFAHRMDVLAISGQLPFVITHTKSSQCAKGDKVGETIFPKVPAISSFKAREEEDDMDDSGRGEIMNALRSSDPQISLLREASLCREAIEAEFPEISVDLSNSELLAFIEILGGCAPKQTKESDSNPGEDLESVVPQSNQRRLAVAVRIDQVTICAHSNRNSFSFKVIGSGWRAFAALEGSKVNCARAMTHTIDLYTAQKLIFCDQVATKHPETTTRDHCDAVRLRTVRNPATKAAPIFYRSQLFPPLSPNSPAILLDILNGSDDLCSEWAVHLTVYNMTHRYDIDSMWQSYVSDFLPIKNDESSEKAKDTSEYVKAALTKIFVTFADCNIDYTSSKNFNEASRSILRVSDIRLSSNIISPPQPVQAFKLSIGDAALLIGNRRHPYNNENACLSRSVTILGPEDIDVVNSRIPAPDLQHMNLITILTLDSFVASVNLSSAKKLSYLRGHGLREPNVDAQLSLGRFSLYACKDSFECFMATVGELSLKLTALTNDKVEALKQKTLVENADSDSSEDKYFDPNEGEFDDVVESSPEDTDAVVVDDIPVVGMVSDVPLSSTLGERFELDGYDWTTIDHEWSKEELPAGEEQVARWFDDTPSSSFSPSSPVSRSAMGAMPGLGRKKIHLIPHYIQFKGNVDPLSEGDMDASRYAGTMSTPSVNTRILLRDLNVKCRFFDGYDWPHDVKKSVGPPKRKYAFIIDRTLDRKEKEPDVQQQQEKEIPPSVDRKKQLMGALLEAEHSTNSTFHNMPLPEERGKLLVDKAEQRRIARKIDAFLQISVTGLKLRIDSFEESAHHRLASCMDLRVEDFFLAETISNSQPTKLLGEWLNDFEHPRDTRHGLIMMRMATWKPKELVSDENKIVNDESEGVLQFLPLRCYVDQRAVRFLRAFFTSGEEPKKKVWASNLTEIPPPVFRRFSIKSCKLKINYTPEKIDIEALRDGSVVELVNLSPINDMVIILKGVEIEDVTGFGEVFSNMASSWIRNIVSTQLHKFVTNVSAFQPITSLSTGAIDMFVLPYDAVTKGEDIAKALRKGVGNFAGTMVYETLNVTSKISSFAAKQVSKLTSDSPHRSMSSSLPSRPHEPPRNVGATTDHAFQSIAQGLETANYKIVIVPYREYQRSGATGAVTSVVRGIPIAVLAPLSGASEALSYTLLGARNQVRPDIRKEEQASQRGLFKDFEL